MLDRAVNEHDRRLCGCGCGLWASETQNMDDGDDHEAGEFTVVSVICTAREALDRFRKGQKEPPDGQLLYVRPWQEGDDD